MPEMNYNYEYLATIARTIQNLAEVRSYDKWILGVSIAGIISSLTVAVFAYRLNKKQITIAEKQAEISREQTEIAKKQAEIMEQQNKIALFEHRNKLYLFFELFQANMQALSTSKDYFNVKESWTQNEYVNRVEELVSRFRKINAYHYIQLHENGTVYQNFIHEINYVIDQLRSLKHIFILSDNQMKSLFKLEQDIFMFMYSLNKNKEYIKTILKITIEKLDIHSSSSPLLQLDKESSAYIENISTTLIESDILNCLREQLNLVPYIKNYNQP